MQNLGILITSVEDKWLDILYQFSKSKFKNIKLPSHDHLHHLRVWSNAKALFYELEKHDIKITKNDLEKTIIAVFFHDMGMVESIEKNHGIFSRQMCEAFFKENNFKIDGFDEVLNAIEKHDDKEYTEAVYHSKLQKNVLSILCVSDDLDAFGAIGVFRYFEIYLMRGMDVKEMPKEILKNVLNRYDNFHNLYSGLDQFTKKEKTRFEIITQFYKNLDSEIKNYSRNDYSGASGVINLFLEHILEGSTSLIKLHGLILKQTDDKYILKFFKQFDKELKEG